MDLVTRCRHNLLSSCSLFNKVERKLHAGRCTTNYLATVYEQSNDVHINTVPFLSKKCNLEAPVSLKWCHNLARVWLDNTRKSRYGSRDGLCAKESKNTKLCQSSVVNLSSEPLLLALCSKTCVESERII